MKELLIKLIIKSIFPFNPKTDCIDKWNESVQDYIHSIIN